MYFIRRRAPRRMDIGRNAWKQALYGVSKASVGQARAEKHESARNVAKRWDETEPCKESGAPRLRLSALPNLGSLLTKLAQMLRIVSFKRLVLPLAQARCYSQAVQGTPSAQHAPMAVQYPYFIPRNSRGSIPVYTDVRNAGGRFLILIRNVEGDVNALARDIRKSLLPPDAPEGQRLHVQVKSSKHLIVTGCRSKQRVVEWLQQKGF
ncbi:hypothetical protein OE88DRAFT_1723577 [Heliocybe sulcata]|uniref:Large ribosomal subunit protein mL49 n=1 Tax=Heliocybe sulcata TaxID=5364 RepID=A0A5C3NNI0_9AGAM|nr:hypothetical protein OE88DRAFT_1723577 [Heliocybe sulcata]